MAKIRYQAMLTPKVWGYIARKKADLKLRNESDVINYCLNKLELFEKTVEQSKQKPEKQSVISNLEEKYGIKSLYTEGSP